jgi:hypothetical protein
VNSLKLRVLPATTTQINKDGTRNACLNETYMCYILHAHLSQLLNVTAFIRYDVILRGKNSEE